MNQSYILITYRGNEGLGSTWICDDDGKTNMAEAKIIGLEEGGRLLYECGYSTQQVLSSPDYY